MNIKTLLYKGSALVASALVTMFLYALLDRSPVVELDLAQSYVRPNPATAGETIWITWSATELRNCRGLAIPRVFDSNGRVYDYASRDTAYHDLLSETPRSFTRPIVLPTVMSSGTAKYEAVVIRWCNVIQKHIWPMVDAPFPLYFTVK